MLDTATLATLDHDRACADLAVWPYPIPGEVVVRLVHRGEPQAWQRPETILARISQKEKLNLINRLLRSEDFGFTVNEWAEEHNRKIHTITPDKTRFAERALAGDLILALRGARPDPVSEFGLRVRFHIGSRTRPDLDNLLGTVMESLSRVVMADDRQVCETWMGRVQCDPDPRTEIIVYRVGVYR